MTDKKTMKAAAVEGASEAVEKVEDALSKSKDNALIS